MFVEKSCVYQVYFNKTDFTGIGWDGVFQMAKGRNVNLIPLRNAKNCFTRFKGQCILVYCYNILFHGFSYGLFYNSFARLPRTTVINYRIS